MSIKNNKPSYKATKLIERLKTELKMDIPADAIIRRTYAGVHQKGSGAWTWFILSTTNLIDIGSCYTITELLKSKKLSVYTDKLNMTQILPED